MPIYFQSENTRTWRNWYLGQHSSIKKHNLLQSQYSFEATFHFERLLERCTNYIPIALQARLGDISFYRGIHGDKNVVWCLKGRYKNVHKKKRTPVIFMVMEWKRCERTIVGQNQFMSNVILSSHKDSNRDSAATEKLLVFFSFYEHFCISLSGIRQHFYLHAFLDKTRYLPDGLGKQ